MEENNFRENGVVLGRFGTLKPGTQEYNKALSESQKSRRFDKSKKYIYPERHAEWKRWLDIIANGCTDNKLSAYYPDLVIKCLMEIESGADFDSILEKCNNFAKNSSNLSIKIALTLLEFAPTKGPDFCEYVYKKENKMHDAILNKIEKKKEENRKLAELHKSEKDLNEAAPTDSDEKSQNEEAHIRPGGRIARRMGISTNPGDDTDEI